MPVSGLERESARGATRRTQAGGHGRERTIREASRRIATRALRRRTAAQAGPERPAAPLRRSGACRAVPGGPACERAPATGGLARGHGRRVAGLADDDRLAPPTGPVKKSWRAGPAAASGFPDDHTACAPTRARSAPRAVPGGPSRRAGTASRGPHPVDNYLRRPVDNRLRRPVTKKIQIRQESL